MADTMQQVLQELTHLTETLVTTHRRLAGYGSTMVDSAKALDRLGKSHPGGIEMHQDIESEVAWRLAESIGVQVCSEALTRPIEAVREKLQELRSRHYDLEQKAKQKEEKAAAAESGSEPSPAAKKTMPSSGRGARRKTTKAARSQRGK